MITSIKGGRNSNPNNKVESGLEPQHKYRTNGVA